jgi:dolichol-phosphate mannosyltransferase
MYSGHSVAVVIPAHNEEQFVGTVLSAIPDYVDRIILVDDCSTDRTMEVARQSGGTRLTLLRTPKNGGVGAAMVLGYREAIEQQVDIAVKIDADGQMPLDRLADLLDALIKGNCDYAKGNRFLSIGELSSMPRHRLFGNVLLTFLTKMATGYWHVFDPQNGFTAIRLPMLRRLDLDRVRADYFFENDMLFQLYLSDARVADVAMPARYGNEVSGIRLSRIARTFPRLLLSRCVERVFLKYILRDFSPVALFLILGALLMTWGGGFGSYLWLRSYATGLATPTGTIMLALVPLILGFQLFLQGVVLDIQGSPR